MQVLKEKPFSIIGSNSFCPGCGHGIVIRLIAEVLDEEELSEKAIGVLAVGCSCLVNRSMGMDLLQCAHGRAAASASAIKRVRSGNLVFTYQGDGDASSIGIAETLYAAQRNENITVFHVNNGVFGMTGGQMSPSTLIGQKTTTSVDGRDVQKCGLPLKVADLLAQFDVAYIARGSLHNVSEINKTKKYIRTAVKKQMNHEGYSYVEIMAPCPTNWHLSPVDAMKRIEKEVVSYYPSGELRKRGE